MTKFGVQGYPDLLSDFLRRLDMPLAAVKVLEPHLYGQTRWIRDWCRERGVPFIMRFVKFFDDRSPITASPSRDIAEILDNYIVPSGIYPDFLELFNEPGTDAAHINALLRYYAEAAPFLARHGIRALCFNFATCNVPPLPILVPQGAALGAHEYVMATAGGTDYRCVGLFATYAPPGAEVFITETGVEPGGHRKHGIHPPGVIRELDRRYADFPQVRAFVWFGAGMRWGWEDYDLASDVDAIRGYLIEKSREANMDGEIMRGLDVSAYSRVDRSLLRWWRERHNVEFVVIQAHGGTPCGTGINPKALAQAWDASREGLRVAVYVWPPSAVTRREVIKYVEAIEDTAGQRLRFVALDVEAGARVSREHVQALRDLGFHPVIYSSPGEWAKVMGNTTEFSDVDYWEANYPAKFRDVLGRWNGKWPAPEDRPWAPATRGGWKDSPIWQFRGSTEPGNVDLSVARRSWWMSV